MGAANGGGRPDQLSLHITYSRVQMPIWHKYVDTIIIYMPDYPWGGNPWGEKVIINWPEGKLLHNHMRTTLYFLFHMKTIGYPRLTASIIITYILRRSSAEKYAEAYSLTYHDRHMAKCFHRSRIIECKTAHCLSEAYNGPTLKADTASFRLLWIKRIICVLRVNRSGFIDDKTLVCRSRLKLRHSNSNLDYFL